MKKLFFALLCALLALSSAVEARPGLHVSQNESVSLGARAGLQDKGWSVNWIANGGVWLRGDLGITNGTGVQTWTSQDSNHYAYTQATGSKQPTTITKGGQQALRFTSASSQMLQNASLIAQAQPYELYCVVQLNSNAANMEVYDVNNAAEVTLQIQSGAPTVGRFYAGTFMTPTTNNLVSTENLFRFVVNGANSQVWQNGALLLTGDAGTNTRLPDIIGAQETPTNFLDGWVWEFVATTRKLDVYEAYLLTSYMGTRYAIAVTR